jgi:chromosomal replication initiation ATPase DnaA
VLTGYLSLSKHTSSDKPPKPPTNVDIVTSRRRKGKTTSNDDFIVDDYCDDSDEDGIALRRRPNPMIVYGPRGHGKTALVSACRTRARVHM